MFMHVVMFMHVGESRHCGRAGESRHDVRWSRRGRTANGNHGVARSLCFLLFSLKFRFRFQNLPVLR